MPFADYKDFDECVRKNKDKKDPEAYCAEIKRKTEKMAESDWQFDMAFTKVGDSGGHMYLAGYASNGDEDEDKQYMDMESLKAVYTTYMKNPVVKLLHDASPQWKGAIGKVIEKYTDSDGKIWQTSFGVKPYLVVKLSKSPKLEWLRGMIDEGMFNGFSIGGKVKEFTKDGKIIVRSWLETSIVDVPSAKGSFFQVLKSACTGNNCPALSKMGTPMARVSQDEYVPTEEDRKRSAWYDIESVYTFKQKFPNATIDDICERFNFERSYCNEILGKLDTIEKSVNFKKGELSAEDKKKEREEKLKAAKKADETVQKFIDKADSFVNGTRLGSFEKAVDSFTKGGPGSGVKGHKTDRFKEHPPAAGGRKEGQMGRQEILDRYNVLKEKYPEEIKAHEKEPYRPILERLLAGSEDRPKAEKSLAELEHMLKDNKEKRIWKESKEKAETKAKKMSSEQIRTALEKELGHEKKRISMLSDPEAKKAYTYGHAWKSIGTFIPGI